MKPIDVARTAARTAGDILQDYFQSGVQMRTKSASVDLVSDADVNAERAIASVIQAAFPDHSILGEEENSDSVEATDLWIVDPLDGTTNFAHGVPHFAVSIGYYVNGKAELGVVYNPMTADWYVAQAGQGAWHNERAIHVSDDRDLSTSLLGTGFFYDRGDMMRATLAAIDRLFQQQIHGIRRFGTASLDLAMVASGQLAGFFEYQLCPWDFAAGRLLIEEAGGRVSTCDGRIPPLDKTSFCATNGHIHEQVLQHVRLR
ncbi:MAG: inositol monophosphatase [Planctomycetaceae bacterium]|nr:inositol monophosphatase [Planctomycetaceae bacterium]